MEEAFSFFSLREEHELVENSFPPSALIFPTTVRKATSKAATLDVALAIPALKKESESPEKRTYKHPGLGTAKVNGK